MTSILLVFTLLVFLAFSTQPTFSVAADQHESCDFWASIGECSKNPNYMSANCQTACSKITVPTSEFSSFYDIIEQDIFGNEVNFNQFRGKVVYLVNVASHCGYTRENYEMFRNLKKYSDLVMILAPCNQFGFQEPGDGVAISSFAKKNGFEGIILSKADVNGPNTRPSIAFLKEKTGKSQISWNFDGKFLIDRNGNINLASNDLEGDIVKMLDGDEL